MRHRAVALILAAALSFSLTGCFGLGDKSEDSTGLTDMLTDIAENATEIARELESIDWSKTVRAVVYDADGEQVAEITDQAQIDEIFSPLSQVETAWLPHQMQSGSTWSRSGSPRPSSWDKHAI